MPRSLVIQIDSSNINQWGYTILFLIRVSSVFHPWLNIIRGQASCLAKRQPWPRLIRGGVGGKAFRAAAASFTFRLAALLNQ
jgi:hypothetical protein